MSRREDVRRLKSLRQFERAVHAALGERAVTEGLYCPLCGHEVFVASTGPSLLESCECGECGGLMLVMIEAGP